MYVRAGNSVSWSCIIDALFILVLGGQNFLILAYMIMIQEASHFIMKIILCLLRTLLLNFGEGDSPSFYNLWICGACWGRIWHGRGVSGWCLSAGSKQPGLESKMWSVLVHPPSQGSTFTIFGTCPVGQVVKFRTCPHTKKYWPNRLCVTYTPIFPIALGGKWDWALTCPGLNSTCQGQAGNRECWSLHLTCIKTHLSHSSIFYHWHPPSNYQVMT